MPAPIESRTLCLIHLELPTLNLPTHSITNTFWVDTQFQNKTSAEVQPG